MYPKRKSGGYTRIYDDLWTDAKFLSLSREGRELFMWALMPPHGTTCGLFKCSLRDLKLALGVSIDASQSERPGLLHDVLDELRQAGMLMYDAESEVVWVVNRVRHSPATQRARDWMRREFRRVPESPLVEQFLDRYGDYLALDSHSQSPSV